VLGVAVCFVFAVASNPIVTDFLSHAAPSLAEITRRISVIDRFQDFSRGIIGLRDVIFFATFIGFGLFVNTLVVDARKAA
jgi:ABC-2 type transport system permease protein